MPVVRLNHRVLSVVVDPLVVVALAGLVALRAQGSRLAQEANSHASRLPAPPDERWFDKVPDREPLAQAASTVPAPAPALPPAGPPPAKTLTDAELDIQWRERALRAAMTAPVAADAFETRSVKLWGSGAERSEPAGVETSQPPAGIVPPQPSPGRR